MINEMRKVKGIHPNVTGQIMGEVTYPAVALTST